jgi:transposase
MLSLEAWHVDEATAVLTLHVTSPQACVPCPRCHVQTSRVHSRYIRTLAELPWGAYGVRMQLRVRKFCCDHPVCPRQICTERLPTVAAPWARRTLRLAQLLLAYGLALGAAAGLRRWPALPTAYGRISQQLKRGASCPGATTPSRAMATV